MPVRTLAIGVAVFFFALACVFILATISAARRRRTWALVFRGITTLCLLGIVAAQLPTIFGPTPGPRPFFKQPAPVSDDATIGYSTSTYGSLVAEAGDKSGGLYLISSSNVTFVGTRARDGRSRWQRSFPITTLAPYIVVDDTIYLSTTNAERTILYALRVADGSTLWQATLPPELFGVTPVVSGGLIFLVVLAPPGSMFPYQLVALRAADSTQVWSAQVELVRPNSLLAQSGIVYYVLEQDGGQLVTSQARRMADGKLLWSSAVIYTVLAAGPDTVYGVVSPGPGNVLVALNVHNGVKRWEFGESNLGFKAATLDNSGLYLCAQGSSTGPPHTPGTVYALDPMTRTMRWHTTLQPGGCGKLTISETAVYTQAYQAVVSLRPTDGSIIWQSNPQDGWNLLASGTSANVLYATAVLDVPSDTISLTLFPPKKAQVFLYAIDGANGSAYWRVPVGPVLTIFPHIVL